MLSNHGLGMAGAGAAQYYLNLARDDYYTQGGEPSGQWVGQGATDLGLTGAVAEADLHQVLSGFDPTGAKPLVQGAGEKHYAGWDVTFSAPKSVSVLWAMTDNPQVRADIQAAQQAAVNATLAFMEQHGVETRRGHNGTVREKAAGLAIATFEHSTSREQDPQLHTHCLVANIAQREDGTWGAVDGRGLYRWKMALGALYRAELAAQLTARLPVQIERDGTSFALQGIPKAVQTEFSKRAEQIQDWLAEKGYSGAAMAQVATLDTRQTKTEIDRPALFARWQQEGRGMDWGPEQAATLLEPRPPEAQLERLPEPTLEKIQEGLVEKHSTFNDREAWRAMAEGMQGVGGLAEIKARMNDFWQDAQVVELGPNRVGETRWSTESMRQLEAQTVAAALTGAARFDHTLSPAQVEPAVQARPTLSTEQTEAVQYLCQDSGSVAAVVGLAGTGKSFMLDTARDAWERAGYRVIGAAHTGKAALGLQESAQIPSQTLHRRVREWAEPGALDAKTVVVVDEAGMVDSRKMAAVIEATQAAGAKLVLVGDYRQLQPIEAGGIFHTFTERMETANLSQIRRQVEPWARDAVRAMGDGQAHHALDAYHQHGLVHVGATKTEAIQSLVTEWAKAGEQHPQESQLMLAGKRTEVRALNLSAREHQQQAGKLGDSQKVTTEHGAREFAPGDRVVFTRNSTRYGVRNGQLGTIEKISVPRNGVQLRVRLDNDPRIVTLPLKHYDHLDHGYAVTTHKAQSMTVDRTFVLAGGEMANRELGLVQLSRHRQAAHLFVDQSRYAPPRPDHVSEHWSPVLEAPPHQDHAAQLQETLKALAQELKVSHQKETTQDYQPSGPGPDSGQGQGMER